MAEGEVTEQERPLIPKHDVAGGASLRGPAFQITYGLIYPAFLGTFIVAIWQRMEELTFDPCGTPPWAALFAIYFALQFAQALEDATTSAVRMLADSVEIALMVWVFAQLGYGPSGPSGVPTSSWHVTGPMLGALAVPLVYRLGDRLKKKKWSTKDTILSILSGLAMAAVGAMPIAAFPERYAAAVVIASLSIYAIFLVFFPSLWETIKGRLAKAKATAKELGTKALTSLLAIFGMIGSRVAAGGRMLGSFFHRLRKG